MQTSERQIRILPAQLANQIAAGEVVERPASVVKELVENSLDAGASKIILDIENGGHKRICIRDDGKGIAKDELQLALSRHATSKIYSLEDLDEILSMGFRGEALASISSVSRCKLSSRPSTQENAWQAIAEGSDMAIAIEPCAHPLGTTVDVQDLFYNTPARRRFLRAPKTEFQHIENVFKRLALANPKVSFELNHNNKSIARYKADTHIMRVKQVFKNQIFTSLQELSFTHQEINIHAWISEAGIGFENNDSQFLFINNRMMKDRLLMHAIRQAYEGLLPDAKHPSFVIYLNMPPSFFDVNVHPAKHEVRFHQARMVHDCLYQALSEVLNQQTTPSNDSSFIGASQESSHNYIRPLAHEDDHRSAASVSSASSQARLSGSKPRAAVYEIDAGSAYQNLMTTHEHVEFNVCLLENFVVVDHNEKCYLCTKESLCTTYLIFRLKQDEARLQQPLLMPITTESVRVTDAIVQAYKALGFDIQQRRSKLILLQVPASLRALPWTSIFAALMSQNDHLEDENEMEFSILQRLATHWCEVQAPTRSVIKQWLTQMSQASEIWQKRASPLSVEQLSKLL